MITCTPVCNNALGSLSLGTPVPVVLLYHTLLHCATHVGPSALLSYQVSFIINWLSSVMEVIRYAELLV